MMLRHVALEQPLLRIIAVCLITKLIVKVVKEHSERKSVIVQGHILLLFTRLEKIEDFFVP